MVTEWRAKQGGELVCVQCRRRRDFGISLRADGGVKQIWCSACDTIVEAVRERRVVKVVTNGSKGKHE